MTFTSEHLLEAETILKHLDVEKIDKMITILSVVKRCKGRVFILGVGGSAANASHAVNDFRKLAGIEAYAPTDNVAEITARTNDEGWETVFSETLKISNLDENDCLFVLSVGGGDREKMISVNLCNAIDFAVEKKSKSNWNCG